MASLTTSPSLAKRQRTSLKPSTIEGLKQKRAPPPIQIGILVLPAGMESACKKTWVARTLSCPFFIQFINMF